MRIERPAFGTGVTAAVKVVLIVQFPLSLLLGHYCVVVAVVVHNFLALANGADRSDCRTVVIIVPDYIRITAVVQQAMKKEKKFKTSASVYPVESKISCLPENPKHTRSNFMNSGISFVATSSTAAGAQLDLREFMGVTWKILEVLEDYSAHHHLVGQVDISGIRSAIVEEGRHLQDLEQVECHERPLK